jgi:hypothetical protein
MITEVKINYSVFEEIIEIFIFFLSKWKPEEA